MGLSGVQSTKSPSPGCMSVYQRGSLLDGLAMYLSCDTKKFHDNESTHILHNFWTSTHRGELPLPRWRRHWPKVTRIMYQNCYQTVYRYYYVKVSLLVWHTRYTDTFCNAVDCRFELVLEVQRWTRALSECLPGGGQKLQLGLRYWEEGGLKSEDWQQQLSVQQQCELSLLVRYDTILDAILTCSKRVGHRCRETED